MREREIESKKGREVESKLKYAIKFRALLEKEKLSPAKFAKMMNFDRSRMSRMMNGTLFPTVQDLEMLKKVFPSIDLNEFLSDGLGMGRAM